MARPKQPIELLKAKCKKHLTKAEIEKRENEEVKASSDNIQAPSYLLDELKEEFNRIANELKEIGIMSNLDCEALSRFLVSEHQYQKIVKKALKMSVDNDKYFSYILMQEKLFKMARQAAQDLGLTISSRCKLVLPKKKEEKKETNEERLFGDV